MKKIKCSTGEVCFTYDQYLRSRHWKNVKIRYYKTYEYVCSKCGWTRNLQLHHTSYAHVGNERMSELTPLCVKCHRIEHGLTKLSQPLKGNKRKWSWKFKLVLFAVLVWMVLNMWFYEGE